MMFIYELVIIGKRNQRVHTSLVQIEGVANKEEAQYYLGKVRQCFHFIKPDSLRRRMVLR
jgi:ribosomal protein L35AE/L33A